MDNYDDIVRNGSPYPVEYYDGDCDDAQTPPPVDAGGASDSSAVVYVVPDPYYRALMTSVAEDAAFVARGRSFARATLPAREPVSLEAGPLCEAPDEIGASDSARQRFDLVLAEIAANPVKRALKRALLGADRALVKLGSSADHAFLAARDGGARVVSTLSRARDRALPALERAGAFVDEATARMTMRAQVDTMEQWTKTDVLSVGRLVVLSLAAMTCGLFLSEALFIYGFIVYSVVSGAALMAVVRDDLPAFVVVGAATSFVAIMLGVPPVALFAVCVNAPLVEEYQKRAAYAWGGWKAVWVFALGELALYVSVFGIFVLPMRLVCAFAHVFWTTRPYREGVALHWTWNALAVISFLSGGGAVWDAAYRHYQQSQDQLDLLGVVLFCVGVVLLVSVWNACVAYRELTEVPPSHQAGRTAVRAADLQVSAGKLFYVAGGHHCLVLVWPRLPRYVEWERVHSLGLRDFWDLSPVKIPALRFYYLFCVECMQARNVDKGRYRELLALLLDHNAALGGSQEMAARRRNRLMHALNGNGQDSFFQVASQVLVSQGWESDKAILVASFLVRLATFSSAKLSLAQWVALFSREIGELGVAWGPYLAELASSSGSDAWEMLQRWFGAEVEGPTHQAGSLIGFVTSEFFVALTRTIVAAVYLLVTGRKLGVEGLLSEPKAWLSFASFVRDLSFLVQNVLDNALAYDAECTGSSLMFASFADVEAELDALLATPPPSQGQKGFIAARDKLIIQLQARMDRIVQLSAGKPELTQRCALAAKRVADLKKLMFTHQYGVRPVVIMLQGEAGVSKSTIASELATQFLVMSGALQEGQRPENVTYVYRASGTKHIDALDEPQRILAFTFDDFGQCQEPERQLTEAAIFHCLASEVKTPLPYASIPNKAEATALQPRLIILCTNTLAFPAAEKFDKDSLTRRVDLCVQMTNLTDAPFGADHAPGLSDVRFEMGELYYGPNNDPKLAMRQPSVLRTRPLDRLAATTDRLAFMKFTTSFVRERAAAYEKSFNVRMNASRCKKNGLALAAHYGQMCSVDCCFKDLSLEPKYLNDPDYRDVVGGEPQHQSGRAFQPPPSPRFEPLVNPWCVLLVLLAVLAYCSIRRSWRRWRPNALVRTMAGAVCYAAVIPFSASYARAWLADTLGQASEATRSRLGVWQLWVAENGYVVAALRWRAGADYERHRHRIIGIALLASLIIGAWSWLRSFSKPATAALGLPEEKNTDVEKFRDARQALPKLVSGRSSKLSGRLQDVKAVIEACTFTVEDGKGAYAYAVSTRCDMVTPRHVWEGHDVLSFRALVGTGVSQVHTSTWIKNQNSAVCPAGRDVAVLGVSGNPRRDVSSHCESLDVLKTFTGHAWALHPTGWVKVQVAPRSTYKVSGVEYEHGFIIHYPPECVTEKGLCGAPIVGEVSGGLGMLLGIHHAGHDGTPTGYGQYVDRELLMGEATLQSGVFEHPVEDVEGRSTRYAAGPITFAGSDPNYVDNTLKSSLRPSLLSPLFPLGGPLYYGTPQLTDKFDRHTGLATGPIASFSQFPESRLAVDPEAWSRALEDLAMDADDLPGLASVRPLSLDQAVNGVPGAIKGIDMATSAGPGLRGSKRDHVDGEPGAWTLQPHVLAQCEKILTLEDPHVKVRGTPKDEVRPLAKLGLPRMIYVMAFAFLVVMKAYLAHLLLVLRASPWVSECAVGINAASNQWTTIGGALDSPGDYRFINTDFKFFDKSQRCFMREAVYSYFLTLAKRAAYSETQFATLVHLFSCSLVVFLQLRGEWFYITDFQPSGDAMTVEVNSVTQRIIFRYWFYRCCPEQPTGSFKQWVWLLTYGDDGLARVRLHPKLDQLSLRGCAAELGFTVTAANKGTLTPYAERETLTFLKRGIVYDDDFRGYRAPLDELSIYKMLCWFDESSSLSEGVWAKQVIENANAEWFLHGRERFAAERPRLMEAARLAGVEASLKSFEEFMVDFRASKFTTWSLSLLSAATDAVSSS